MATLLDLTSQGDVATISDESKLSSVTLMTPQQLYELWERQNWISHQIDLSRDVEDWSKVAEEERDQLVWFLSSFFIGEERVTTQFSGLVMAYESQSEEAFLTTQQVDEARHTQHFNRLYEQVIGYDGTFDDRLDRARENLNDAFKVMFDENLVDAGNRLISDPSDREAKVDFIVTYHMLIEGVLALTGQYFLTEFLESRGLLPGFVEGFKLISQDEHRHVAYGTWYLKEAAKDPELARRIQDRIVDLLPTTALVFVPPGVDPTEDWSMLGYTSSDVNEFAFTALTRRLKVIGVGLPAVAA